MYIVQLRVIYINLKKKLLTKCKSFRIYNYIFNNYKCIY